MQGYYDEILEYFSSELQYIRIGAIYALYCVFTSQPPDGNQCSIRVARDRWQTMFQFYIAGATGDKEHASATFAFKQLLDQDAFVHVIQTRLETSSFFEIEEMRSTRELLDEFDTMRRRRIAQDVISACRPDAGRLSELLDKYQEAKRIACMTPQYLSKKLTISRGK
ncbi:hypothetical protein BJV82DRAFT_124358 [Fennellomyces sp. T-0311]|nr:hypothetical protein BJV82DRAFT_124358 [Fennellomyces sp. T-0311]